MDKEIAIIGMSPGNSYFKDGNVRKLFQAVSHEYMRAIVLIPDIPAISTYQALGYTDSKAKSKAVLKGNNLRNRSNRIIQELNLDEHIRVLDWSNEIEKNKIYQAWYQNIAELYNDNEKFRKEVLAATSEVVESEAMKMKTENINPEKATHYLISEIAFMEASIQIYECKMATYIYHRNWPIYERYIAGEFDKKLRQHLGFKILK